MANLKNIALVGIAGLVLGACSAGEDEDSVSSVSETQSSIEEVSITEENSSEESKEIISENSEEDSDSTIEGSENRVYGVLKNEKAEQTSDTFYKETVTPFMNVLYTTVENKEIFLVDVNISKLPSDLELDKQHLTELAADYMETDATLIQTKSDTNFIYESASINKKYEVIYTLDDSGQVINITIGPVL